MPDTTDSRQASFGSWPGGPPRGLEGPERSCAGRDFLCATAAAGGRRGAWRSPNKRAAPQGARCKQQYHGETSARWNGSAIALQRSLAVEARLVISCPDTRGSSRAIDQLSCNNALYGFARVRDTPARPTWRVPRPTGEFSDAWKHRAHHGSRNTCMYVLRALEGLSRSSTRVTFFQPFASF